MGTPVSTDQQLAENAKKEVADQGSSEEVEETEDDSSTQAITSASEALEEE